MTRRLGILLVAVLCASVWARTGDGRVLTVDTEVSSVALGGRMHALVVLPADYATSKRRYPVVYFLHGLPATSSTYRGNGWLTRLGWFADFVATQG